MKLESTNIILLNEENKILLHLRDNKPTIMYPNRWVLPGGYVEEGETPMQCIIREIAEELGVELKEVFLFVAARCSYGTEHTFWARANFVSKTSTLLKGKPLDGLVLMR